MLIDGLFNMDCVVLVLGDVDVCNNLDDGCVLFNLFGGVIVIGEGIIM